MYYTTPITSVPKINFSVPLMPPVLTGKEGYGLRIDLDWWIQYAQQSRKHEILCLTESYLSVIPRLATRAWPHNGLASAMNLKRIFAVQSSSLTEGRTYAKSKLMLKILSTQKVLDTYKKVTSHTFTM